MRSTMATAKPGASQGFDLATQVGDRPLFMFGIALAAGYALGSLGGTARHSSAQSANLTQRSRTSLTTRDFANRVASAGNQLYSQQPDQSTAQPRRANSSDTLAPLRGELDNLTSAGVTVVKQKVRELVRDYAPADPKRHNVSDLDPGMPDPSAGRDYVNTYHPPSEQGSQ